MAPRIKRCVVLEVLTVGVVGLKKDRSGFKALKVILKIADANVTRRETRGVRRMRERLLKALSGVFEDPKADVTQTGWILLYHRHQDLLRQDRRFL